MPTIRPLSPWTQVTDNPFQDPAPPTRDASTNLLVNVAFPPGNMSGQAEGTTSAANPNVIATHERRFRRIFEVVAEPNDQTKDFQASVRHSFQALAMVTLRGGRDFVPRTLFGRLISVFGASVPLTATSIVGVGSTAVITELPGGTPGVLPGALPLFDSSILDNKRGGNSTRGAMQLDNVLKASRTRPVYLFPETRYTLELETGVTVLLFAPIATASVALAFPRSAQGAFATGSVNVGWPNLPSTLPRGGVFVEFKFPVRVPFGGLFGLGLPGLGDGNQIVDEDGKPVGDSGG